jgi:hypothetical protein
LAIAYFIYSWAIAGVRTPSEGIGFSRYRTALICFSREQAARRIHRSSRM